MNFTTTILPEIIEAFEDHPNVKKFFFFCVWGGMSVQVSFCEWKWFQKGFFKYGRNKHTSKWWYTCGNIEKLRWFLHFYTSYNSQYLLRKRLFPKLTSISWGDSCVQEKRYLKNTLFPRFQDIWKNSLQSNESFFRI